MVNSPTSSPHQIHQPHIPSGAVETRYYLPRQVSWDWYPSAGGNTVLEVPWGSYHVETVPVEDHAVPVHTGYYTCRYRGIFRITLSTGMYDHLADFIMTLWDGKDCCLRFSFSKTRTILKRVLFIIIFNVSCKINKIGVILSKLWGNLNV